MASDPQAATRTRDALLDILKRSGASDVRRLAEALEVSEMAVRQHLQGLEADGLVRADTVRRPVGRPARVWMLTQAAQRRYPDAHSDLAIDLIGDFRALFGEEAMDRLLARRAERQITAYREAVEPARDLRGRLEALAALRSREGYMAEVTDGEDGALLLVENHCPVCEAARACAGLCRSELEVFRAALGEAVDVERTDHILAGARRCAYRVRERT